MTDTQHILALLDKSDPEDIREGAQLAGEHSLAEAIPALVRHVVSPNIGVQEAVDRALRKIGGPAVVHAVIPLLRSDEAPARNLAMDILRELGRSDMSALQQLLKDDDADIRIFGSDILGATGSALAVPALCHALLNDPEVNVRYQAAVSLGVLRFPESAACLNQSLGDEEWVQFSAIEALTKLKDSSSVGAMIKALDKASELVASTIVDALAEMGDIKVVPLLLKRLDSSPAPLCNKIVRAVVNVMGDRSLTLLGAKDCDRLRGYLPAALADEDTEVQEAALRGIAALGGTGAVNQVLRYVEGLDAEEDTDRVASAIEALVAVGSTPELKEAVRSPHELVAQVGMEVLLHVDEASALPLLEEVFRESPRDQQRRIIMELASRAGQERQDFFLDVLARHPDGNVMRGCLLYLGRKGDPAAVLDKVVSCLEHAYNDVKEAALEALIALHTPEVEQLFREYLKTDDTVKRMIGAYGLGFFDLDGVPVEMVEALDDPSPDVRKVVVEAFGRACPMKDEHLELVERKLGDENREVRMAVFDTLGMCSNERYFKSLLQGLQDPDAWVRVRCVERLGESSYSGAVEALVHMLVDENLLVVIKAVAALGGFGGESAFRALLPLLEHEDRDVQLAAEEAVNAIHRQAGE